MALSDFKPISQDINKNTSGLVWHGAVQEGKYLAELQTSILPQVLHLIIFDIEDDYKPVHETISSFKYGDALDAEAFVLLQSAVDVALEELNA